MKILMIAPEPFFEPRGTPFSEYFRIRALGELGHKIDLATYPLGQDVDLPGLRIYRSLRVPFIHKVKVGPSLSKIVLDFFLTFSVLRLLLKNKYDCIHTHEEACFMGAVLSRIWRIPHVYDMHSSLPQQFKNFDITRSPWVHRILEAFERKALRFSDAVIAICPYLGDYARSLGFEKNVFVIENTPEAALAAAPVENDNSWESDFKGKRIVLYAGTFEPYQGLDLLIRSAKYVVAEHPEVLFLLIGGDRVSIENYRKLSDEIGISDAMRFMEKIPAAELPKFMEVASVLVSPRKSGTNTPLKIYSYLRSGKPIVATDLVTHTQVLNRDISILTQADPESFAKGILEALESSHIAEMVRRAQKTAEEKYSYEEYVSKTSRLYAYIGELRKGNRINNNAKMRTTEY